ncbi:levansucrase [Neokomagataea thailandica NBRC 106555]|uniref:Levansucrase n=1 Tax=Neokomagataea thailandica NBRC 106555 TaxID=1223520 RepID=A0ABQ0QRU8_9PROT|nr:glycoside hydrolase family 68 protein [Neokomagataea thailandica]GBR54631.1 levansucrase [Neokomagataea thailandica NBRC 106555]
MVAIKKRPLIAGLGLAALSVMPSHAQSLSGALASILRDTQHAPAPGIMPFKSMKQRIPLEPGYPAPSTHTGAAHDPYENYTGKWTRADARQIKAMSNPNAAVGANSLPTALTMPAIPVNFPVISDKVWVWDTWPLTDASGNQYSYNGWEVIFCLTADKNAGYTFDDRHTHAKIGFFYRRANIPTALRPAAGGWIYGGDLFPAGSSQAIYSGQAYTDNAQWSGSSRIEGLGSNGIMTFYTDMAFNRDSSGANITPPQAIISIAKGKIHADATHVWFTGFDKHIPLLQPDGTYYQTGAQNEYFSFRDPYTFKDPANPGKTFMVFEGNSAGVRGQTPCDASDLGYQTGDKYAETVDAVNGSGAIFQRANIGLAVATNSDLTQWKFLPPLVSANCVNDQTERPQMYIKNGNYYLLTISHRTTFAAGMDGPDGEYGFYGRGIRSDWVPLNNSSGLMLGNPTDLNTAAGADWAPNAQQNPNAFQSYSHYLMPNGKIESFIDTVQTKRGGTLSPTVQVFINGPNTSLNSWYGYQGLGGYGDISANLANINLLGLIQDSSTTVLGSNSSSGSAFGSSDPFSIFGL